MLIGCAKPTTEGNNKALNKTKKDTFAVAIPKIAMCWIPPGEFDMGSNFYASIENPEEAKWFTNEALDG